MLDRSDLKTFKLYIEKDRFDYSFLHSNIYIKTTKLDTDKNGIVSIVAEDKDNNKYLLQYKKIDSSELYQKFLSSNEINLSGRYIEDFQFQEFDLPDDYKISSLYASCSYWEGLTDFKSEIFGNGEMYFRNAIFNCGPVDFQGADFCKNALNFNNATFNVEEVSFNRATFDEGTAMFISSRFNKCDINFELTSFGDKGINFMGSVFDDVTLSFNHSTFEKGNINFWKVQFSSKKLSFNYTTFKEGKLDFTDSNFGKCDISFDHTIWGTGKLSFKHATGNYLFFGENEFTSDIDLRFKSINQLNINSCTNKQVLRITGVKKLLSFYGTINSGRIELDWLKYNVKSGIENFCWLDEKYTNNYEEEKLFIDIISMSKDQRYYHAAQDFHLLKENYRNMGQYEWEDAAYRAYMKYNTKSMKWLWKNIVRKPFNWLFGLISGYGTTIWKMLITCPVVIFLFGLGYLSSFVGEASMPFWTSMYFSTITFLTIGYGDISPITLDFSIFQTILTGAEGFLGLLLMSLVTVVVVRKVLR